MQDKWVGLLLAISGSFAIGTSFIITKKVAVNPFAIQAFPGVLVPTLAYIFHMSVTTLQGLNDASSRSASSQNASDDLTYLKNPIWWAGMTTMVLGEFANFAAYTFAPAILVTPLGALSVLIGAVLASFFLGEELGPLGRMGSALCLLGSLIIVLHAPPDKEVETVDQILFYAVQPGFMLYCLFVTVVSLVLIFKISPRYGKKNPLVYLSICSLVGSVSVMAIKGFGVAIKLTFSGNNQLTHPSTYVFGIVVVVCIMIQMNYFNKALDTFSTNVVNPIYYVGFSTATISASLILFQGFNTTDATNTITLLTGFFVTFLGVQLLNLSRSPEPAPLDGPSRGHARRHSLLDAGLMNPRVSLAGRSISMEGGDNWVGSAGIGVHGQPLSASHGRRSSLYRAQNAALQSAFGDDEGDLRGNGGPIGLELLREDEDENENEDEDEDEFGSDERTKLNPDRRDRNSPLPSGARSPLQSTQ